MASYLSPSRKSPKNYYQDIPTAAKSKLSQNSFVSNLNETSHFQTYTPKYSKYNERIVKARQKINEMIGLQQTNQYCYNQGISRVKSVNEEALRYLKEDQFDDNRGYQTGMFKRPYSHAGDQHYQPPYFNHVSHFTLPEYQQSMYSQPFKSRHNRGDLQNELNQLTSQNRKLNERIKMLEMQNQKMNTDNKRRVEYKRVPSHILKQLEQLHAENEKLRKETIKLMQKKY